MDSQHTMKLGYLAFEASRPDRWQPFCERMLGLPAPAANADGSVGYRLDAAAQRLIVTQGPADDLGALGLELVDDAALDALVDRLRRAQIPVAPGDGRLLRARRVRRLVGFADPAGNRIEAFVDPEQAASPFESEAFPGGFNTGELGLGHAAIATPALERTERFYVEQLGFGVSERLDTRVGPVAVRGVFMHCNRRHHTIAILDLPLRKRLHHFMLEANAIRDVGRARERADALRVPLSLGLGQHPDPDGTFSFYARTPSGFDFEIGAGGKQIDPAAWDEIAAEGTSAWGHAPSMGLQMRMAGALVASRVARLATALRPGR